MVKRGTWILFAILLILITVTLVVRNTDLGETGDQTTPVEFLYDVESADILYVEVNGAEGETVHLSRDDLGSWQLIEPENPLVDITRIDTMATKLSRLRVYSTLEDPPSDEDIGLDAPPFHVVIEFIDGTRSEFDVGDANVIGNGYYIRLGTGLTKVVNKSNLDSLLEMLDLPPVITPTPTLGPTTTPTVTSGSQVEMTSTPTP